MTNVSRTHHHEYYGNRNRTFTVVAGTDCTDIRICQSNHHTIAPERNMLLAIPKQNPKAIQFNNPYVMVKYYVIF